ncbi:hypothetical protein C4K20_3798 [Pseudomonas chlororaphis subsp. aurantiaca]|nr:hypothetical protein C4K20_3798 [Pseudomonas chlororaphis subsp. aurantiaca]
MPFGKVAGIRDENRAGRCTEEFATGSPRPVVVKIGSEAGLLADGAPVVGLANDAPSRRLAVALHRSSPVTVAGAAAAWTAFPS